MEDRNGRVVLITGGGSGIGRAAALKFLENGDVVYISDISRRNLDTVKSEYAGFGDRLRCIQTDVSVVADCEDMVRKVVEGSRRLDVLVNSAGISIIGPIEQMGETEWNRVIDINLKGTFFACRFAIPELEKTEGVIVNLSSVSGLLGGTHEIIYSASKGGTAVLTKALALELAPKKVRVNAVCPGDVATEMLEKNVEECAGGDREGFYKELLSAYPAGENARFARPEEIAEIICFLASPSVGIINGALISADGGFAAGY
jgi:NAD(P)-dependent dehydrogenase (short-subunit alcohol dehydrogenase family)